MFVGLLVMGQRIAPGVTYISNDKIQNLSICEFFLV
jgi:hypothetical protein